MLTDGTATINAVWSPDGKRIATIESNHGTRIFTVPAMPAGEPTRDLTLLEGTVQGGFTFLANSWSPKGDQLAGSMSGSGRPAIYSLAKHKLEILPEIHDQESEGELTFLPDGKRLLLLTWHQIAVIDRKLGSRKRILTVPRGDSFLQVGVSRDGKQLYTLSRHSEADLWALTLSGR
jgi:Tol biopolymer transport system component